ncbi:MAG TPA: M20/M25/M40 family metallo-hydrolase, partial [Candidatus Polarisedimenticolia bacterium]|nr:M20/M25/M40 family metallo-hydrolase [Candidatus Polarisedimenticolia bacterium]
YNVTVTEKVPFWIKIIARGRPGHGSQPFEKDNAVLALLRSLRRLAAYETPIRVTPAADAFFKARAASEPPARAARFRDIRSALQDPAFRAKVLADPALNAILRDTIAITMLKGSPQTNIIPTVAEAQVDIRLLPGTDPQAFLKQVRSLVQETGVTVETVGAYLPATASPVDSEMVKAIDRVRARHHPDAVLAPTILTGWTESAVVRSLGIKAYGFEPYVLDESEQERVHGNDERISVDNVLNGAAIMQEIVADVAR